LKHFVVEGIGTEGSNPFSASLEEMLAAALNEAGLVAPETMINGRAARGWLESWNLKTSRFREISRLGDLLLKRGVLTENDLGRALRLQEERGGLLLGEALVELGVCSRPEIEKILGTQVRLRDDMKDLVQFREKIETIKERLRRHF
jgi:hypothetical protein